MCEYGGDEGFVEIEGIVDVDGVEVVEVGGGSVEEVVDVVDVCVVYEDVDCG